MTPPKKSIVCRKCGKEVQVSINAHGWGNHYCRSCIARVVHLPRKVASPAKRGFNVIRETDGMTYWKNQTTGQYVGSKGEGQPECSVMECPICHHHASDNPEYTGYCSQKCKDEMMAALIVAADREEEGAL
jgi:endogenous inhibitor of DNA gyrase (YacG/DUF329 family)